MRVLVAVYASLVLAGTAGAQRGSPARPVTIPSTELRTLESAATGRGYDVYVHLPNDYARNLEQRYPVVYVLDGQWDFKLLASVYGGLVFDKFIPELIVVGVTYSGARPNYDSLRAADYTTIPVAAIPGSGGAARFLSFFKRELIPFIEASYRAQPSQRVLIGSSFGGLFTLYAMFADPGLFTGYLAASPAVSYGDRAAFKQEAEYAVKHRDLPVRLYLAVGEAESLAQPVKELMQVLGKRGYLGLTMETRVVEGERHSGNKPEAFNRGLRFLFRE